LEIIRAQRDQLLQNCTQAMRRSLFGAQSYGLDANGTEECVEKFQIADLKAFHRRVVSPNNCVLAIFGDVHAEDVRAAVEKQFGAWQPGANILAELPPAAALNEIRRVSQSRDKKQAVLVMGFPGLSLNNPERYALELLQEACSDLGSRLFVRIRDNLGLAYYVGAQNFMGLAPGYFAFYAGTAPDKVAMVESELLKETAELGASGLAAAELQRAKSKLIGQKKIARQDLGSLALSVALDELYGLGYESIDAEDEKYEAVTVEEVREVAQKYLTPGACVISVVGP
jgi:zinc protease